MSHFKLTTNIILFSMVLIRVQCFWPPSYDIRLDEDETFEISEELETADENIAQEEDEIIHREELNKFHFNENLHKFDKIHGVVATKNKDMKDEFKPNMAKYEEINWHEEEIEPKAIGFIGEGRGFQLAQFEHSEVLGNASSITSVKRDVLKEKEESEHVFDKRQSKSDNDYNYDDMKKTFDENSIKEENDKKNLKYEEVKETESAKDSLSTILKEKDKINCTIEEMKGIGVRALLCFLKEPTRSRSAKFFSRMGKICLVWFIVYLVIAIPLWCTRGWCCCCFRCMICRPNDRIDMIKKYYVLYPPGIVEDDYGHTVEYKPTRYEKYFRKELGNELGKLISY
ncbi:hypothetical protein WA026_005941 [Henosepilachna vigintioctopunctata]|uniref:Uncharacterized protein n=1 Tax=Henosepilachna vigintioctopunctata TaxID=420089 RepID=A0AAW1U4S2_9CUCU